MDPHFFHTKQSRIQTPTKTFINLESYSLIGCASAWYADGRGFDPHVRQHSFVEIGHEIIFSAILSLPLIQEGQLSVTGERMCTKYL